MDAVGALEALEALGDVDDLLDVGVGVVHRPQLGRRLVPVGVLVDLLEAVLQRRVTTHHERRHRLGDLVADRVREAEHAGCVAHRVAGLDGAERDDLGDVVAPVPFGGIADHLVPIAGVEVHVDVGHRDPARIQEALEQQVVLDRVEVGDPQAVRHRAPGRRATARPDPDAEVAGVLDEIPGDEEVRREPHVVDDLELIGDPLDRRGGEVVAPSLAGTGPRQVFEVLAVDVKPSGTSKLGSSASPNVISSSARSAIHNVLSHASGTSRNRYRISSAVLR